jgi:hypothetical protein
MPPTPNRFFELELVIRLFVFVSAFTTLYTTMKDWKDVIVEHAIEAWWLLEAVSEDWPSARRARR